MTATTEPCQRTVVRYRRRMVESGQRADAQFKVLRLTADVSFAAEFETERELVTLRA